MISPVLISSALFFYLGLGALALPLGQSQSSESYCSNATSNNVTYPSWTVESFSSKAVDSVGSGGRANFTILNNLTGAKDELSCTLQVNYRCIITGVPSDENLTVHVAVRAGSLTFILDETVVCEGKETPLRVIGNAELELDCSWVEVGGTVECGLKEKEGNVIKGEVVDLAPEGSAPTGDILE